MSPPPATTPVVKWAGGKTRLLTELLARLPSRWNRYYEPFAGGAALFFALAPEHAVVADTNADLIAMYRALAQDPAAVIRALRGHDRLHSTRHFYDIRSRWNEQRSRWTLPTRAGAFIYLNKSCFNGLWRVNRDGHFNVPIGRHTSLTICAPGDLHAAHAVLRAAELRIGDFRDTLRDAGRGDLVYCDPPYDPASATAKFTSYSASGFAAPDQRALAETVRSLVARGCHVVVSNSDTPLVHELYQGFHISRVRCARSINSCGSKRGAVNELIIVGTGRTVSTHSRNPVQ